MEDRVRELKKAVSRYLDSERGGVFEVAEHASDVEMGDAEGDNEYESDFHDDLA